MLDTMHHSYLCYASQNLAVLLYQAADDNGYVDPDKVQVILGITKQGTAVPTSKTNPTNVPEINQQGKQN